MEVNFLTSFEWCDGGRQNIFFQTNDGRLNSISPFFTIQFFGYSGYLLMVSAIEFFVIVNGYYFRVVFPVFQYYCDMYPAAVEFQGYVQQETIKGSYYCDDEVDSTPFNGNINHYPMEKSSSNIQKDLVSSEFGDLVLVIKSLTDADESVKFHIIDSSSWDCMDSNCWTLSSEAKRQDNKEGDMPPYSGVQVSGNPAASRLWLGYRVPILRKLLRMME
mmetsp:Transcript_16138/g.23503  ORF Transcript_16138/g.23503 Transcript_16138/m.23503 type:complete len:218 (-) Transcript_16138:115-768(-)